MPQASSSALADIFGFEGTRAIGEPTRLKIQFTHPSHELSRRDYVNKMATFVTQVPHDPMRSLRPEPPRRTYGVVTAFAHLSGNRDESTYEIVLESRLALLRNTPKVRW